MKLISIVIPVYCEGQNIENIYKRLEDVRKDIPVYRWEYIFVNDGSTDNSYSMLQKLAVFDKKVKVIDFSRNFGKEIAMSAGVMAVSGDAAITLDADLQHPPELIPEMIRKWEKGADIVIAVRKKIKVPLYRRIGSALFNWAMNKMSQINTIQNATDFRLIDKKIINVFKTMSEKARIYRGLIDWLGFRKDYVEFNASLRESGSSTYTYMKLLGLAIRGITSFSAYPLKIAGIIGFIITLSSTLLLMIMFPSRFIYNSSYFSPLSLVVVINTLLTGIMLSCLGFIALYIENIHNEVVDRPLFVIRDRLNFNNEKTNNPLFLVNNNIEIEEKENQAIIDT